MNDSAVRRHLVGSTKFNSTSLEAWINQKSATDRAGGCKVAGVLIDGDYAGWCGIQHEDDGTFGLGVILDQKFWGHGWTILQDLVDWSRDLGHDEVFIHLLESRPVSKALLKRFNAKLDTVDMLGRSFHRYRIAL